MLKNYNKEKLGLEKNVGSYKDEITALEKELFNLNRDNKVSMDGIQRENRQEITMLDATLNTFESDLSTHADDFRRKR